MPEHAEQPNRRGCLEVAVIATGPQPCGELSSEWDECLAEFGENGIALIVFGDGMLDSLPGPP
jgi:hypothetical protein